MSIIREIEEYRKAHNIPIYQMCNILDVTEASYNSMLLHNIRPDVYQMIMFICATEHPLSTLE